MAAAARGLPGCVGMEAPQYVAWADALETCTFLTRCSFCEVYETGPRCPWFHPQAGTANAQ